MKLFSTKHSRAELYVHATWATLSRARVLDRSLLGRLASQARSTALKLGAATLAFDGTDDHVHTLLRHRPDLTVSNLVRSLKAAMTRSIRRDVPHLPDFEWQTGYGAFSVSPKEIERVIAYISNQRRHHADGTTWPGVEYIPCRYCTGRSRHPGSPAPDRADSARGTAELRDRAGSAPAELRDRAGSAPAELRDRAGSARPGAAEPRGSNGPREIRTGRNEMMYTPRSHYREGPCSHRRWQRSLARSPRSR
jgi:REP element-mobilizing transposase RayT